MKIILAARRRRSGDAWKKFCGDLAGVGIDRDDSLLPTFLRQPLYCVVAHSPAAMMRIIKVAGLCLSFVASAPRPERSSQGAGLRSELHEVQSRAVGRGTGHQITELVF
jgi:hypothetical protein